jgi:hypothetical protein
LCRVEVGGGVRTGAAAEQVGSEWRVRYEIDDGKQLVVVLDIRHRSIAYRRR